MIFKFVYAIVELGVVLLSIVVLIVTNDIRETKRKINGVTCVILIWINSN